MRDNWERKGDVLYFDFESSLEAAGKETTKRPDERHEGREEDTVDLEGVQVNRFLEERGREDTQINIEMWVD